MVDVTFLLPSGARKMAKTFSVNAASSYPNVKTMTSAVFSHALDQEGLKARFEYIKDQADKGAVLLKGHLTRGISNESRKGLSDKERLSDSIVFDIDGLHIAGYAVPKNITRRDMKLLAEEVISWFPKEFADVSYICHASSSMGMKGDRVCMHLEFLLSTPAAPQYLKLLLEHWNLTIPEFRSGISLTPSGTALSLPLDPTLAQNSRLIYIAPPLFLDPVVDPVEEDARLFHVLKKHAAIDISAFAEDATLEGNRTAFNKIVAKERKLKGLPSKKESSQTVLIDGVRTDVVTNPDLVQMTLVSDDGDFLRFNINNGDSAAYYVRKSSPTIVYNFKGEKPFLLEPANPELFTELMDSSEIDPVISHIPRPYAFRDMNSDKFFSAFRNAEALTNVTEAREGSLKDFFAFHGTVKPDVIPQMNYSFVPTDSRTIDLPNQFINMYQPPRIVREPAEILEDYKGLSLGEAISIASLTPTIFKVIYNVCGSSDEDYEFFINWLAAAIQTRDKLGTTWIFHGTQGTGKGVLFEQIIRPMFGVRHCSAKRLDDIGDQFNAFIATNLFIMIDEFRMRDSVQASKLDNMIKQLITEKNMTVRGMRQDQRDARTFTNYIFCSNNDDCYSISEGDRRFNVAPKQERMLADNYPGILETLEDNIKQELPLFTTFLLHYKTDLRIAKKARETKAKAEMRALSKKTHEKFTEALRKGDLDFFIEYFFDKAMTDIEYSTKAMYDTTVKRLICTAGKVTPLSVNEIRTMYQRIMGKPITSAALGRLLNLEGIETKPMKISGSTQRGFKQTFMADEYDLEEIIKNDLDAVDVKKYATVDGKPLH